MRESALATILTCLTLLVALGCASSRTVGHAAPYGIGSVPGSRAIGLLDTDVARDGTGLPIGHGTASDGAAIYAVSCRSCHGERIDLRRWPYPTALFDYIRRAMPPQAPRRFVAADLYAITAFLLYTNGRVGLHDIVDRKALARSLER